MSKQSQRGHGSSKNTAVPETPKTVTPKISCQSCENPDDFDMVQCDNCDLWHHYVCVGVTNAVRHVDWICKKCLNLITNKNGDNMNDNNDEIRSNRSSNNTKSSSIENLELRRKKQLEIEMLEREKILKEKRDNNDEIRSSRNSNKTKSSSISKLVLRRKKQIELEMLEEERILNEKRDREYFAKRRELKLSMIEDYDGHTSEETDEHEYDEVNEQKKLENVKVWLRNTNINNKQIQKTNVDVHYKDKDASCLGNCNIHSDQNRVSPILTGRTQDPSDVTSATRNITSKAIIQQLTSSHIAARQGISKDLPLFSGRCEEWPLFISAYEQSTHLCGFSNEENLVRLQKSLKGKALEAVRCRLMLPAGVPNIISTLKRLYGRPELILHDILQKIM